MGELGDWGAEGRGVENAGKVEVSLDGGDGNGI